MGRAEELFIRIREGGAAEVHAMINASVVEELFLDYKQSSTALPAAKLSDDDRKNLAKAIAGFGNSEGGIVVWGVDCRQTLSGDVPTRPVPISQPAALKTLFDGAIGGLTLPAHSAVENIALLDTSGTGGFVVTHVPVGLHVPYQTLHPKHEYYIRAGSGFQPTPHGVLAGMFGRVPQPNVVPIITFQNGQAVQNMPPVIRLSLPVTFVNKGRGLAEDVFCTIEHTLPAGTNLGTVKHAFERVFTTTRDGRTCITVTIGKETILPPGAELLVLTLMLDVDGRGKGDLSFTVSVGSRNGPGAAQTIIFPGHVIDDAYAHYTFKYTNVAARQAAERGYEQALKACLPPF
ncbi:MAG: helix-turn-helix domain-containing protein [Beijerinckiaceae bacterium]